MAAGDIEIRIDSETKAFRMGVESGIIEPLEDAEKALDDLGRTYGPRDLEQHLDDAGTAADDLDTEIDDAKDAADKLSMSDGPDDLEKAMKDAQTATDDLKDEIGDTRDALEKLGRAGKTAGDDTKRGIGDAEEGVRDFKEEAHSTAREAAASFDGSAESIGDAFQEVAANAFAGFGPAGAIAGLAAAAGIGLVMAGFNDVDARAKESEEAVAEWADAFIEAGDRALTAGVVASKFQDILTDPEKFKTAEKNAKDWGVSVETAVAAMAGNQGSIDDVNASINQQGREFDDAVEKAGGFVDEAGNVNGVLAQQQNKLNTAKDSFSKLTGEINTGRERAGLLNQYYEDLINSTAGVTKEVDELGNELYSLPDGTQVMVDVETGQATQNVSNFKGDLDGIPESVTSTVKIAVDTSAWDNWNPVTKHGDVYSRNVGMNWQ